MNLLILILISTISLCACAEDNSETKSRINRAVRAFDNAEYEESEKLWLAIIKDHPHNPVALYNYGNTLLVQKKFEKARKTYFKVITMKSDLAIPSRLYLAHTFRHLKQYSSSVILLDNLLSRDLPDGIYNLVLDEVERHAHREIHYYNRGKSHFEQKHYRAAFINFKLAWILNPSPVNYFMLGYTRLKQGLKTQAKNWFSGIKDPEIYKDAEKLLDEFDMVESEEKLDKTSVYADLGFGQNSNPNTQNSSETFGMDAELIFAGGASYILHTTEFWSISGSTDLSYDKFLRNNTTRSESMSFSVPIQYYGKNQNFGITPSYEFSQYGGGPYVNNLTGELSHGLQLGHSALTSSYTFTRSKAQQGLYQYLNGNGHYFSVSFSTPIAQVHSWNLGGSLQNDNLQDSASSIGSKSGYGADLGFDFLLKQWCEFSLSGSYFWTNYESDSDLFYQKDETLSLTATFNFIVNDRLTVYLKDKFIDNSSNLESSDDNNNYAQNLIMMGVSWYGSF